MGVAARYYIATKINLSARERIFATMGTEENGAPLSVLSGLTRLGIDPWIEGARLAKLPEQAAARALTPLIALFPKTRLMRRLSIPAERRGARPVARGYSRYYS
jgi:hypothetical protein